MIVEHIGTAALLEQTAEECCELAQACLKMSRKIRDDNPTPKNIEDIRDGLIEEVADVYLCLDVLLAETNVIDVGDVESEKAGKLNRWKKRLDLHMDVEGI